MPKVLRAPYRSPKRSAAIALLVFLVLTCVALVISTMSLRDRLEAVRAANSDNVGWLISQLDVDYKALQLATKRYILSLSDQPPQSSADDRNFGTVLTKFDIFYSRVDTVLATDLHEDTPPDLEEALDKLEEVRASLTGMIDAITTPDQAQAVVLSDYLREQEGLIRNVTTLSLVHQVGVTKMARTLEKAHLQRFWLQSLLLLGLMIGAALMAFRLWRGLEEYTARLYRVSGTITKVMQAALNAVVVTDTNGRILLVNTAASDIFRISVEEMQGRNIADLIVPDHLRAKHEAGMRAFKEHGKRKMVGAGVVRTDARRADGSNFQAELSITADTDFDGKPILIGFIRDISDMVAAERKLREARDEAQRHADAKTMFLATMSHEMRTPLHGVNAALELMDAESLSPEDRDLLRTALECSDRALEQVNNVLDITRLGERRDEGDTFGPAAIARTIIGELSPLARENRNRLGLEITGRGADALYMGAPDAFSRALYNLLGNALKFTRDGQVDLKLEFENADDGEGVLTVHVVDTGPGIAPEDHERIFREFETGRPGELFGPQGTGLGLSIVRIAVQHLGGSLTLDSAPGKGSRFSFEMPLRPAPAGHAGDEGHRAPDPVSQPAAAPVRALDVLVVDDSEVNLGLMCEMVRRLGHRTAMARNGREAVDAATARAFDVILMDVSMPVMRGDEATRQIRKSGASRGALIAAVTAACDTARRVELHEAGIDAVLVKPTKRADIADLLAIVAGGPAPAGHAPEDSGGDRTQCTELLAQLEPMIGHTKARELMRAALDDIPAQMLQDGAVQELSEGLIEQLHKAAGSTAVVGLTALSGDLLTAERAAVAGDVAGLNAQKEKIAQQLRDCRKALALLESV